MTVWYAVVSGEHPTNPHGNLGSQYDVGNFTGRKWMSKQAK